MLADDTTPLHTFGKYMTQHCTHLESIFYKSAVARQLRSSIHLYTFLTSFYISSLSSFLYLPFLCEQVLFVYVYNNPAPLNGSTQFHYCTDSNPGTRADDAFVSKRGVWRNATWPSHSQPAIAATARHFQICFFLR